MADGAGTSGAAQTAPAAANAGAGAGATSAAGAHAAASEADKAPHRARLHGRGAEKQKQGFKGRWDIEAITGQWETTRTLYADYPKVFDDRQLGAAFWATLGDEVAHLGDLDRQLPDARRSAKRTSEEKLLIRRLRTRLVSYRKAVTRADDGRPTDPVRHKFDVGSDLSVTNPSRIVQSVDTFLSAAAAEPGVVADAHLNAQDIADLKALADQVAALPGVIRLREAEQQALIAARDTTHHAVEAGLTEIASAIHTGFAEDEKTQEKLLERLPRRDDRRTSKRSAKKAGDAGGVAETAGTSGGTPAVKAPGAATSPEGTPRSPA